MCGSTPPERAPVPGCAAQSPGGRAAVPPISRVSPRKNPDGREASSPRQAGCAAAAAGGLRWAAAWDVGTHCQQRGGIPPAVPIVCPGSRRLGCPGRDAAPGSPPSVPLPQFPSVLCGHRSPSDAARGCPGGVGRLRAAAGTGQAAAGVGAGWGLWVGEFCWGCTPKAI